MSTTVSTCGDAVGTRQGYRRHKAAGEPACDPCKAANAAVARARRAAKKASTPAASTTAAPVIPDKAISYLAIAKESVSWWSTSRGHVDPEDETQTVLEDGSVSVPTERFLAALIIEQIEEHRPAVLLVSHDDAVTLSRVDPWWPKRIPETKPAIVDEPTSWVFESDGNRARHLASTNPAMIILAARIQEDRADFERQQLEPAGQRVQGATVARGRMFRELREYEQPHEEPTPIPEGHPILRQESFIGAVVPKKRSLPWSGRR